MRPISVTAPAWTVRSSFPRVCSVWSTRWHWPCCRRGRACTRSHGWTTGSRRGGRDIVSQLVTFGPGRQLVGILSGDPASSAPLVVLPNAGLVPRAGPFRLHVELAERLASRGIRTFRFDTPGVGEAPRLPGCGVQEATIAALDRLAAEHGGERFVVGGICSAADLGWSTAVLDRRVVGMLMLDGIAFTGSWFHFARLAGVFRRGPGEWLGILRRWLARTGAGKQPGSAGPTIADYRDWPDRASARRLFAELVARGTRSLWIYTGGYSDLFLHPRQ